MDKTVDGYTYQKARFLRTTCKQCGKDLDRGQILQDYGWCNKKCKIKWIRRNDTKNRKRVKQYDAHNEYGAAFDYEGNAVSINA